MSSERRPSFLASLFSKRLFRWILLLVVLLVIGYFAYGKGQTFWDTLQDQWAQSRLNFQEFGYSWFAIGLIVYLISVVSTFLRWRVLLHALHIRCTQADAIRLGFLGYVTGMFLPGSTMGDALKAGFVWKENPGNRVGALASIVVDRIVGLYSLFLLSAFVGLMNLQTIWSYDSAGAHELRVAFYIICAVSAGGLIFYLLFMFMPLEGRGYRARIEKIRFVGRVISKVLIAFAQYRRYPRAMVQAVVIGMGGHIGFVLSYYFASMALPGPGPTPDWQVHFLIIPFFMVFQAVPLTPGGNLVVGDALLGKLYEMVGAKLMKGLLASLFQRLLAWMVALIGLIWYIPLQRRYKAIAAGATSMPDPVPTAPPASTP